jgi:Toprim domain
VLASAKSCAARAFRLRRGAHAGLAGGFTAGHAEAFRRHRVRRVLIAYDRDDAGERAAAELAAELTADGVECFRIEFPAGQDANDVAVAARNPADALGRAIRSASWMGAGPGPARRRNAPLPEPAHAVPSLSRPPSQPPHPPRLRLSRSRSCQRWLIRLPSRLLPRWLTSPPLRSPSAKWS